MAKELDRAGIPVIHVAAIVPISLTVGANRIMPAVAIPHPLGNPELPPEEERLFRLELVKKALRALQTEIEKDKNSKPSEDSILEQEDYSAVCIFEDEKLAGNMRYIDRLIRRIDEVFRGRD